MMKSHALVPDGVGSLAGGSVAEPVGAERRRRSRAQDQREFRITVAFLTAVFLPFAVVSRIVPIAWRPFANAKGAPCSVLGRAKAAAHEIAPFMLSR